MTGPDDGKLRLRAIFGLALYYGVAGFGGGYSVLAQLRRELVERKRLVSEEDFLVFAELSKSLPGTAATSLLALLGQRVGGVRGGLVAAGAFLLPSTVLMIGCGAAYPVMRAITRLSVFFDGMNAAMVGIVGAVTADLARSALRSALDVGLAVLSGAVLATRVVSEPVLALVAVAVGAVRGLLSGGSPGPNLPPGAAGAPKSIRLHGLLPVLGSVLGPAGNGALLGGLVRVFLPIGVMTFGGGLAMIPAIEHMVVADRGWLDPKAFADAIALGQITPGPVAICATFIGYRVAGVSGAIAATLAMFVPATALALAAGHSMERFRRSRIVEGALRMLAPAVIGMLGAATFSLGKAAVGIHVDAILAVVSFVILLWRPISPLWLLMGGGVFRMSLSAMTHM